MIAAVKTQEQKTAEDIKGILQMAVTLANDNPMRSAMVVMIESDGSIHTVVKMASRVEMLGALTAATMKAWEQE